MTRPNIVMLVNDHQAYYGHGRVGGPAPERPNFDRLVGDGVSFSRAYAVSPLCSPARRTMLTGLFPHTHRQKRNLPMTAFDEPAYLRQVADEGYRVFYFGKWHAGPGVPADFGAEGVSPPDYGNPYVSEEYAAYVESLGLPHFEVEVQHSFVPAWWDGPRPAPGERYTSSEETCNEHLTGIMTSPRETHESFFLAHQACEALKMLAGGDEPFHLRVDFWGPHPPYFAPRGYWDRYDPETIPRYPSFDDALDAKPAVYRREYNGGISDGEGQLIQPNPLAWSVWQRVLQACYAQISLVDDAGGMILDTLDELGLADDTVVIWTTDHGDAVACHGGHFDKESYLCEEVLRVPLGVRWPGHLDSGATSDRFTGTIDLAPTILDAAGLDVGHLPGRSLRGAPDADDWRDDLMGETAGHFERNYSRYLVHGRWKYVASAEDIDELYDLESDPFELNNLATSAGYDDVLADLRARLRVWQARTADPVNVLP